MQIYYKKKRWKWLLFGLALIIFTLSLWYTNILAREIAKDERTNIHIWANAIHRKANLVNYTKKFFDQIKEEEKKRAEILAGAYQNIQNVEDSPTLTFYWKLIDNNTTIPIILTNKEGRIISYKNISDVDMKNLSMMTDSLKNVFSSFDPIKIVYYANDYQLLYFKESKIYTELRMVLNDLLESFFSEVVGNSASVPVLITDSTHMRVIESGNIDKKKLEDKHYVESLISKMSGENDPIVINLPEFGKSYIYYMDSLLLRQILYYPYVQFIVIGVFLMISYLLFSTARKSEQNLVWIGMSKETAHQLGTPLSSIMAWIELLKIKGGNEEEISEIEKDIRRLENITERFSKIGSPAKLVEVNIVEVILESIDYLKMRTSRKVIYSTNVNPGQVIIAPVNIQLFEWVVENLCKNAVDAMNNTGNINISVTEDPKTVIIDFEDTGKGISKSKFKSIFHPGFTSKKRGWGLGLSLSKRIIENYHKGKIFVKSSAPDKGTVFRVILKK